MGSTEITVVAMLRRSLGCEEDGLEDRTVALGHVSEGLVDEPFRLLWAAVLVSNHIAILVLDALTTTFVNRGHQMGG